MNSGFLSSNPKNISGYEKQETTQHPVHFSGPT